MGLLPIIITTLASFALASAPHYLAQGSESSTQSVGGSRVVKKYKVTIANDRGSIVYFSLDGSKLSLANGQVGNYTVKGLNIVYDGDTAPGYQESRHNLDDGGKYRFRDVRNRIVLQQD